MFVTIINDCQDANAFARQLTRAATLFNAPTIPLGVNNELEAAGNLIDVLDTAGDGEGVILLNVAPRHGKAKKWPNGTPFAYFRVNKVLVVASIDGHSLSLIKKFSLAPRVQLMDIPTVLDHLVTTGDITKTLREQIIHTQFRSLEFVPRVAKWLTEGKKIPSTSYDIGQIPDTPAAVWFIDNFGNCKTTLLPEDIGFSPGKIITTAIGKLTCYDRLKDVPNHTPGLIIGSSGYKKHRFLEIVVQGKSAQQQFHLHSGSSLK